MDSLVPVPCIVILAFSLKVAFGTTPKPVLPLESVRILSVPSVVTLKCPSEPVSTTSAVVLPSIILSASGVEIVPQLTAPPEPPLVNT